MFLYCSYEGEMSVNGRSLFPCNWNALVILEIIGERRRKMFDQLIRSKVQWLVDNDQEIIETLAMNLINKHLEI